MAELKDESAKLHQVNATTNLDSSEKSNEIDENGDVMSENNVDRMKSSISVVQEIAQKRNLPIRFMVENESGPAHMKHFVIKCTVGDIEVSILCMCNVYNKQGLISEMEIDIFIFDYFHS